MTHGRKLIEVALPLDAINEEGSRRKRKAPAGYPTTLHKWWAQRPVAAARAVIFAQMVDDPSAHPDLFSTEKKQERERLRLFKIIEDLVLWENTANETVLQAARDEIWASWRRACAENADHPRAKELFDRHKLPAFHDPFAGSGALPLEAQRLGLESYASDLNPVAVLINKAMIEIPPKFAGKRPVNPEARKDRNMFAREWKGAQGLAEDVRYYGEWMRGEAEKRIGHLYPKVEVTAEMAKVRPDLKPYVGKALTVIAWLWARTVKSPNPAFARVEVPLASTFMLSTKAGKEVYVEPVIENGDYRFTVKVGKPKDTAAKNGTSAGKRAAFKCVMSGTPLTYDYIRVEGQAVRMGARLMAIVADGDRGRVYLAPTPEHEAGALEAKPEWKPDTPLHGKSRVNVSNYGFDNYGDLFTPRQLVSLTTFADLVQEARERVKRDAIAAGLPDDNKPLRDGGIGPTAYAEAVCTLLSMAVSRLADYGSTIATWRPKDNAMRSTMPKQAIQMTWDFAEGSPFGRSSSGFRECVHVVSKVIDAALGGGESGTAQQANARDERTARIRSPVVSTDPPYYDNIGYADLSDFFYAWLRRSLQPVFPDLFATLAVPKADELVATPYRHGSKEKAESFWLDGMTHAMHRLAGQAHPAFPVTIYYAFKQSESDDEKGTASTGWDTFLAAVIEAGFSISGTWPMRTEGDNRSIGIGTNALASSIILVCRPRPASAPTATRREFVTALKAELPQALANLQRGNIAPVDLAQAAIGPGMAVYTRYARVLDAEGKPLSVRQALALINQTIDEALAEQEGDFDADSRWALTWFEQSGFAEGEYGVAEQLSKSKNTSVAGMERAGILEKKRGKVRLLRPAELPADWDPATDPRLTAWEIVHHLIRALESGGERAAAVLVTKLGAKAEVARELGYRLYRLCERKKRAAEALSYNALVESWPEVTRLAQESRAGRVEQAELLV
jgi:putative DNA methylase